MKKTTTKRIIKKILKKHQKKALKQTKRPQKTTKKALKRPLKYTPKQKESTLTKLAKYKKNKLAKIVKRVQKAKTTKQLNQKLQPTEARTTLPTQPEQLAEVYQTIIRQRLQPATNQKEEQINKDLETIIYENRHKLRHHFVATCTIQSYQTEKARIELYACLPETAYELNILKGQTFTSPGAFTQYVSSLCDSLKINGLIDSYKITAQTIMDTATFTVTGVKKETSYA